jgi:hypothetical protein
VKSGDILARLPRAAQPIDGDRAVEPPAQDFGCAPPTSQVCASPARSGGTAKNISATMSRSEAYDFKLRFNADENPGGKRAWSGSIASTFQFHESLAVLCDFSRIIA